MAKLLAADVWVVLDDVQFNARDYQHRLRLAPPGRPTCDVWLTLPVHRPRGRASSIREIRLAQAATSARRLQHLPRHYYRRSPRWPEAAGLLASVVPRVTSNGLLVDVTEASTTAVLRALGWRGRIVRSSSFPVRSGRSERLADLTAVVGATEYLCGSGGARYLDERPFLDLGLVVRYVAAPPVSRPEWNRLSILGLIAAIGLDAVGSVLGRASDAS